MIIDNTVDLHITKLPPAEIVTFDCNPEADVDLHNKEGKCCCWIQTHTYDLVIKATEGAHICGIAGIGGTGPSEHNRYYDVKIEVYVDGQWILIDTIPMHTDRNTPFEVYFEPVFATAFRFSTLETSWLLDRTMGLVQFGDTPADSHMTLEDCEAAGCHWYNGSCHLHPPLCKQITTQAECEQYGCYWAQDACHPMPTKCGEWLEEQGCIAAGCEWWEPDHPYDPNSCHELGTKVALLDIDPNEPADIHSDEPPGSQWVNFNFGKRIKIYRAVGTGMIKKGDTGGATSLEFFIMRSEMWQNRVLMSFGWPKDFDEDFNKTDEWRRYGNVLKCGNVFEGVTVEILRMLVYYKDA